MAFSAPSSRIKTVRAAGYTMEVHPSGAILIRPKGDRKSWTTTIEAVYHMAVKRNLGVDGAPRPLRRKHD